MAARRRRIVAGVSRVPLVALLLCTAATAGCSNDEPDCSLRSGRYELFGLEAQQLEIFDGGPQSNCPETLAFSLDVSADGGAVLVQTDGGTRPCGTAVDFAGTRCAGAVSCASFLWNFTGSDPNYVGDVSPTFESNCGASYRLSGVRAGP